MSDQKAELIAEYVRVPLVLVEFIAERFVAVDVSDKLALAALKSYIEASHESADAANWKQRFEAKLRRRTDAH